VHMIFVLGVENHFQELLVAGYPADIFRRQCCSPPRQSG
jgi:hypothetical protein